MQIIQNSSCEKSRKVPIKERPFLSDQQITQKMMIGSADKNTTLKNINNMTRKLQRETHERKILMSGTENEKPSTISIIIIHPQTEIQIASPLVPVINTTNVFPVVARILDRYCVSDRVGAAIVSATLQDISLITLNDKTQVVDRRACAKNRKNLQESPISFEQEFLGLYYDGRKDKTV
uniref:Uncharacterized protein n=1 Tax=Sipha flava TaxID=143950 RepID=A0A2S2PWS5_9HEMI